MYVAVVFLPASACVRVSKALIIVSVSVEGPYEDLIVCHCFGFIYLNTHPIISLAKAATVIIGPTKCMEITLTGPDLSHQYRHNASQREATARLQSFTLLIILIK